MTEINPTHQTSDLQSSVLAPKISVIIPTYNKSSHLARLLPSILAQDYDSEQFEIIIVDDGSTDETALVAQQFADRFKNYRYVYQKNLGIGSARNTGLGHARGELISFVADDYVLHPSYLTKLSSAFADDSVYGVRPLFNSIGRTPVEMAMYVSMIGAFKKYGARMNQIIYRFPSVTSWGGASMTRRCVFDEFGPFLEEFATGEDAEYGIRLAQAGIHIHIYSEVLFTIKNRSDFFEANRRLYEYGFNGMQLNKYLKRKQSSLRMVNPALVKAPFIIRLARLIGRPLRDSFKHADSHYQAMKIVPIAYSMLASSVFGMLHGKVASKSLYSTSSR